MRNLMRDKKGATAIEYGLLLALISIGAMGAVEATGGKVQQTFCTVAESFGTAKVCDSSPAPSDEPDPEPVQIAWGLGIGSDENHQCAYRYNYRQGSYVLNTSADNRGACSNVVSSGDPGFTPPPQENIDLWNKGGRDDFGDFT